MMNETLLQKDQLIYRLSDLGYNEFQNVFSKYAQTLNTLINYEANIGKKLVQSGSSNIFGEDYIY